MPRLPRITAKQIISILERRGFKLVRQSGSHKIYRNLEGKRTTVPFHDNKTLHPKILKSIIKDAEIELDGLRF
ncbi:MAG: type II toxin-antitoxin system HicA family toxin [Candidatus Yanofskybacteria bacterium]|nr:type II toxin-antitoxin system HicA family toxin [Candidatus Yanofskybacteria bacterium]